jgi:hypothetical protein
MRGNTFQVGRMGRGLVLGLCLASTASMAQSFGSIPRDRIPPAGWENTQWANPGGWQTLDVSQYGLRPNDSSQDASAKLKALVEGGTTSGRRILYFPPGVYYFKTSLRLGVGDLILSGAGKGLTIFRITSPGDQLAQIELGIDRKSQIGSALAVTADVAAGAQSVTLADASSISVGNFILLGLPPRVWEAPTYSQIFQVTGKSGHTLSLDMKAGLSYPAASKPTVQKIQMLQNVGIEKLKVHRTNGWTTDPVNTQNAGNLVLSGVYNGFVRDVESETSIRSHVSVDLSRNVVVERNDLYGTLENRGGWGYGVSVNWSTRVRVTDNKTWDLRHHILLQTGANHCVVAYNSLEAPYMDYNDMALHSTHAYMNLFEGNRFKESYADNSKAGEADKHATGPGNTWFRNFASGGVGSINDATYRQNVIGSVVGSLLAADNYAKYQHYFGANRVSGTDTWGELSSTSSLPGSLYLTAKPDFFGGKPWPLYGPGVSTWGTSNTPPAAGRERPALFTVDPLTNWSMTYSHAGPLTFDTANGDAFGGDTSRATRNQAQEAEIVWNKPHITAFRAIGYHWPDQATSHFSFLTSPDGATWTPVTPAVENLDGNWKRAVYTVKHLSNVHFVKVRFNNVAGENWAQQLSQMELSHGDAFVDRADSWAFTHLHSPEMTIDTANGAKFAGDEARYTRTSTGNQSIQWRKPGMSLFNISTYYWPDEPISHFFFDVSADGSTWTRVTPQIFPGSPATNGDWQRYWYTVSGLEGMNYVKVTWGNRSGKAFSPQIGQAVVR